MFISDPAPNVNDTSRFPKKKDTAYGFDEVLKKHNKKIIESYELEAAGNEIYITKQVECDTVTSADRGTAAALGELLPCTAGELEKRGKSRAGINPCHRI